ncbi:MAG: response regulator [Bacteroidales bacterium]|nr:response regulator [Bacteroidales bacterium]
MNSMIYDWKKYTTLLVEDDEISYKYMELVLKRRTGIKVIWAKTGQEAIDYCTNNDEIDIVLMDLQLPDVDGYQATTTIKSFRPYLPIVIQTANSWNDEKEKCFEAGCDGYVTKPINLNLLFTQMETFLRQYTSIKKKKITT